MPQDFSSVLQPAKRFEEPSDISRGFLAFLYVASRFTPRVNHEVRSPSSPVQLSRPNIAILCRPSVPYTCPPSRQEAARRPGSVERRHSPPYPSRSPVQAPVFPGRFPHGFSSFFIVLFLPFVYGAGQFSRDLCLRRVRGLFATSAPIFSPVLLVSCLPLAYGAPLAVAGFFRQFCLHLACDLPPCRPSRQEAAGAVAGHRAGSGPTRSDQYPRSATRAAAVRRDLQPSPARAAPWSGCRRAPGANRVRPAAPAHPAGQRQAVPAGH